MNWYHVTGIVAIIAIIGGICLFTMDHDGVKTSDDSSDFVLLSEAVPDAILEIRYYSTYNFVGDRIDGYEEPVALLTKEAATALREVSDELVQKGYRLKIYDASDHRWPWTISLDGPRIRTTSG